MMPQKPSTFLSVITPCSSIDINPHEAEVFQVFLPSDVFTANAQGFGQLHFNSMPELSKHYLTLLQISAYFCTQIIQQQHYSNQKCFLTIEYLPLKVHKESLFVAKRVRLIVSSGLWSLGMLLEQLFITNAKLKQRLTAKKWDALPLYQKLDKYQWKCICRAIGAASSSSQFDNSSVSEVNSPFNPIKMDMLRDVLQACSLGADMKTWSEDSYIASNCFIFPYGGQYTYQIPVEQWQPDQVSTFFFPHVSRQSLNLTVAEEEKALCSKLFNDPELYNQCYGLNVSDNAGCDIESFGSRCRNAVNQAVDREAVQQEQLEKFNQQYWISENNQLPDSIRAILSYCTEHKLQPASNVSVAPSRVSNLKELLASWAVDIKRIFEAQNDYVIADIITALLSCFQVYTRTPFHLHMLMLGPPGIGKSFVLKTLMSLLIPGTFNDVSHKSIKSRTANPGFKLDSMIEIQEEIPPTVLGSSQTAEGSDHVSLLKTVLTTGKLSFQLANRSGTVYCNSILLAASNEQAKTIPESMVSRFNLIDYHLDRQTSKQNMVPISIDNNSSITKTKHKFIRRMQNLQALSAYVGYLLFVGILDPVDMNEANAIFTEVLNKCNGSGNLFFRNLNDRRHLERLQLLVQSLVITEAILLVFGRGKEVNLKELQKGLVSRADQAVFALGLLRNQYENVLMRVTVARLMMLKDPQLVWPENNNTKRKRNLNLTVILGVLANQLSKDLNPQQKSAIIEILEKLCQEQLLAVDAEKLVVKFNFSGEIQRLSTVLETISSCKGLLYGQLIESQWKELEFIQQQNSNHVKMEVADDESEKSRQATEKKKQKLEQASK